MNRPPITAGLRHVAFHISNFEACEHFYVELLGMAVEWRPDADSVYLCSSNDNLALHRVTTEFSSEGQHLDHIGFILRQLEDVDKWYEFLVENKIEMRTQPKTHRDGARSFYCFDPDGNTVQMIFHPPISGKC